MQDDQQLPSIDDDTKKLMGEPQQPSTFENNAVTASEQVLTSGDKVHSGGHLDIEHALPWYKKKIFMFGAVAILLVGAVLSYFLVFAKKDPVANDTAQTETINTEQAKLFGVAVGLVEGTAEYSSDGTTWQPVTLDTDLSEDDSVRTADSSRTVLLIDDGSAVRLSANSQVKLTSLKTDDVQIDNVAGEVYSRVVASESRAYAVSVGQDDYKAKGTAYRTFNTASKKGVEVFHSTVEVASKTTDVTEGNAFYTTIEQKEKENVISAIDLDAIKSDEFLKWCADQDKQNAEFADKLGALTDIDKPKVVVEAPKPTSTTTAGITLKGSQSEYSAVFSWTVTGNIDVSKGYKLVRSKKTSTPTYPNDTVVYIEAGKKSYTLYDGDGNTYTYRLCAYRDGACDNYSNAVSVTTKKKEKPPVEAGAVTLNALAGTTASWTFAGTAPNGFKLVMSTTASPTYPGAEIAKYVESNSVELPTSSLMSGSTYYIRVCKYTNEGGCQDYSNEITYLAP